MLPSLAAIRRPHASPTIRRSGCKRLFIAWVIVAAAYMAFFLQMAFADLLPRPERARAILSLVVLALVPANLAAPVLRGLVSSLVRSTTLR